MRVLFALAILLVTQSGFAQIAEDSTLWSVNTEVRLHVPRSALGLRLRVDRFWFPGIFIFLKPTRSLRAWAFGIRAIWVRDLWQLWARALGVAPGDLKPSLPSPLSPTCFSSNVLCSLSCAWNRRALAARCSRAQLVCDSPSAVWVRQTIKFRHSWPRCAFKKYA